MKYLKSFFVLFLMVGFTVSCSSDDSNNNQDSNNQNNIPLEYYQELNIDYGDAVGQQYDIYLPAGRTLETKVLILVHGGSWIGGDKIEMNNFVSIIQEQLPDYAIVNMNYRLANAQNLPYPMQTNDITSVVNHLKANRNNYVISEDLGFIGVSAGGHLSLLWSYAFDTENAVNMVCSIVGPTNLTDPAYTESTNPVYQGLIELFTENEEDDFLQDASPYHRVTTTAPPTILFYGEQDPLVPTSQGTAMRDKLEELGVTHSFTLYENEAHGWVGENFLDTSVKLKSFIQQNL